MKHHVLRHLATLAATSSLTWFIAVPESAPPVPGCPPGSEVGMDDFIVWVDDPGGGYAEGPIGSPAPCTIARTITFRTFDITAMADVDYVGVTYGRAVLMAGTTSVTIRIQILGKTGQQPDAAFGILLESGASFSDPEAVVTVKRR